MLRREGPVTEPVIRISRPGKGSSRCFELNHMLHRLCGSPSIPLSFILANVLPRWSAYCVCDGTEGLCPPTPSTHRLRRGLPGYLILFAPHAFEPQRQLQSSKPPSPLVFFLISTHFNRYTRISAYLSGTPSRQFQCSPRVKPWVSHQTCLACLRSFTPSKSG